MIVTISPRHDVSYPLSVRLAPSLDGRAEDFHLQHHLREQRQSGAARYSWPAMKTPPEFRGRWCCYALNLPRVSIDLIEDRFREVATQHAVLEVVHEAAVDDDDKPLERCLAVELFDPIDAVE